MQKLFMALLPLPSPIYTLSWVHYAHIHIGAGRPTWWNYCYWHVALPCWSAQVNFKLLTHIFFGSTCAWWWQGQKAIWLFASLVASLVVKMLAKVTWRSHIIATTIRFWAKPEPFICPLSTAAVTSVLGCVWTVSYTHLTLPTKA